MDILGFTNNLWTMLTNASSHLMEWFYTPIYNDYTVLHACFGVGLVAVLAFIVVKWIA